MTVERLLRSIGKATYIKYYYSLRDKSRDYCISKFEEALINIANSNRVDPHSSAMAKEILIKEFKHKL